MANYPPFKVKKIKFTPLSEGGEPIGEPMYTWTAEEATVTVKKQPDKPAGMTKVMSASPAAWGATVSNEWLRHRAHYVTRGFGITKERQSSFEAALIFYSYYMSEESPYAAFATAALNVASIAAVDAKYEALEPVDVGKCTCSLEYTPPVSTGLAAKGTFTAYQCGCAQSVSTSGIAVRNVARRALWCGWSTSTLNSHLNSVAHGVGSYAEFIDAWEVWLPAHGFAWPPHNVAQALSFVPAIHLPPFFAPGSGLPDDTAKMAYGVAQTRLNALSKVVAQHVLPEVAKPSTALGQFANLTKEGSAWYGKMKTTPKLKFAAGGHIPDYTISASEYIGDNLTYTSSTANPTLTKAPKVKSDELALDIGAGRTLRFFKTTDGRLDVELVGGKDEDMTAQATLLLARVAELIEAKAPKDITDHGPCLYDWLTDNVGVNLKTKDYDVAPGSYFISEPTEALMKSTYVTLDSPTKAATLSPDVKDFIEALESYSLKVVTTLSGSPVPVADDAPPTVYLTYAGISKIAKAWATGTLGPQPLAKIKAITMKDWASTVSNGEAFPWGEGAASYVKHLGLPIDNADKKPTTNVTVDEKFMDSSILPLAQAMADHGIQMKQHSLYSTLPVLGSDDPATMFITLGAASELQHAWQAGTVTMGSIVKWLPMNTVLVNKGKVKQFITMHTVTEGMEKPVVPVEIGMENPVLTLDLLMTTYHNLSFLVVPDESEPMMEFNGDPQMCSTVPVTKGGYAALVAAWENKTLSSGTIATYVKAVFKQAKTDAWLYGSTKITFPVLGADAVAVITQYIASPEYTMTMSKPEPITFTPTTVTNGMALTPKSLDFAAALNDIGVGVTANGLMDPLPSEGTYDEPMLFVTPVALSSLVIDGVTVDAVKAWVEENPHELLTKNKVHLVSKPKPKLKKSIFDDITFTSLA